VPTELNELAAYLDRYLAVADVADSPDALNGLQVEAAGPVTKVAAAVDATEASIAAAVEQVRAWLENPALAQAAAAHNYELCRQYYSYQTLSRYLTQLMPALSP